MQVSRARTGVQAGRLANYRGIPDALHERRLSGAKLPAVPPGKGTLLRFVITGRLLLGRGHAFILLDPVGEFRPTAGGPRIVVLHPL